MKKIENAENHEINERLFIKWFLICYISIFIFFSCLLFFANFHLSSSSVVTLIRWTTNKVSLACAVGAFFSGIWVSNWEHVSTGEWFVFSRFRQDENGDSQRMTSAPTWYFLHLEFSKNNKRRNSFNIWGITKPQMCWEMSWRYLFRWLAFDVNKHFDADADVFQFNIRLSFQLQLTLALMMMMLWCERRLNRNP